MILNQDHIPSYQEFYEWQNRCSQQDPVYIYAKNHILLISVQVRASIKSIIPGKNFSIDCNIFVMNDIDYLELKGEFLLRQNHNIIRPIKVIIGDTTNATKKYKWTIIYNCTDQSQNRTCMTLRLEVFSKFFF